MTELQPLEKDKAPRHWILPTFGLAFGLAVLMVVIVFVAVMALESPSNRRTAVRAAPVATVAPASSMANATPIQTAAEAPAAIASPLETPVAQAMPAASAPASTAIPVDETVLSNHILLSLAQSPAVVAEAATTPTSIDPTPTPLPTRSSATARSAVRSTQLRPRATPTPVPLPLDMSFYVKAYCHKTTDSLQVVDMYLTAHGGVPPYDYYDDMTFIAHDSGMVRFTMKASSGNPVPYKLIILDSSGQRIMKEFFYQTGVKCQSR